MPPQIAMIGPSRALRQSIINWRYLPVTSPPARFQRSERKPPLSKPTPLKFGIRSKKSVEEGFFFHAIYLTVSGVPAFFFFCGVTPGFVHWLAGPCANAWKNIEGNVISRGKQSGGVYCRRSPTSERLKTSAFHITVFLFFFLVPRPSRKLVDFRMNKISFFSCFSPAD